jgi:hypothetical protein
MWLRSASTAAPGQPAAGDGDHAVDDDVRDGAFRLRPAGVLVTSNLLTIAQQKYLRHPPRHEGHGGQGARRRCGCDAQQEVSEEADLELIERARKLFSGRIDFLLSAPSLKFCPIRWCRKSRWRGDRTWVKSSLLNAITGRKSLAHLGDAGAHAGS